MKEVFVEGRTLPEAYHKALDRYIELDKQMIEKDVFK